MQPKETTQWMALGLFEGPLDGVVYRRNRIGPAGDRLLRSLENVQWLAAFNDRDTPRNNAVRLVKALKKKALLLPETFPKDRKEEWRKALVLSINDLLATAARIQFALCDNDSEKTA